MALKKYFLDGYEYTADDLNKITKRLVTSGIADCFENGMPHNVNKICDLTKSIAERGVVYESDTSLKVVCENNQYLIKPGNVFFDNGTTAELTEDYPLVLIPNVFNYIYIKSDLVDNDIQIKVSDTVPDYLNNLNIVYLASVSTDGTITDHRHYAVGKLVGYQNYFHSINKIHIHDKFEEITNMYGGLPITIEHDLGMEDITFFILISAHQWAPNYYENYAMGIYDITNSTTFALIGGTITGPLNRVFNKLIVRWERYSDTITYVKITHKEGTVWTFEYTGDVNYGDYQFELYCVGNVENKSNDSDITDPSIPEVDIEY